MAQRSIPSWLVLSVTILAGGFEIACGSSPSAPGAVIPPPVVPPNQPPVIEFIIVTAERVEVDTETAVTATVRDAETPIDQLKFEWKADAGTFSGEGASVRWRAPRDLRTPADYSVRLTVTETYGSPDADGTHPQHVVNGTSPAIRVHDSPKELGDLSMAFLGDFANSSVTPSACVKEFSDSCPGKADEKGEIEWNRDHFLILSSSLRLRSVRIASNNMSADMRVNCTFTSRVTRCEPGDTRCVVGMVGTVGGDCDLTGVYEQRRWWLCESRFNGAVVPFGFRSFLAR